MSLCLNRRSSFAHPISMPNSWREAASRKPNPGAPLRSSGRAVPLPGRAQRERGATDGAHWPANRYSGKCVTARKPLCHKPCNACNGCNGARERGESYVRWRGHAVDRPLLDWGRAGHVGRPRVLRGRRASVLARGELGLEVDLLCAALEAEVVEEALQSGSRSDCRSRTRGCRHRFWRFTGRGHGQRPAPTLSNERRGSARRARPGPAAAAASRRGTHPHRRGQRSTSAPLVQGTAEGSRPGG